MAFDLASDILLHEALLSLINNKHVSSLKMLDACLLSWKKWRIDWSKTYSLPFLCTQESKLRVFQFKLVHRRISTNRYLFKVGLSSSEQCTFCENTSESLLHLFWECPKTKIFLNEVIKWLGNFSCLSTKRFSPQLCLGFVDDTTALLLHHAFLIARYHIFWANQCTTTPR